MPQLDTSLWREVWQGFGRRRRGGVGTRPQFFFFLLGGCFERLPGPPCAGVGNSKRLLFICCVKRRELLRGSSRPFAKPLKPWASRTANNLKHKSNHLKKMSNRLESRSNRALCQTFFASYVFTKYKLIIIITHFSMFSNDAQS